MRFHLVRLCDQLRSAAERISLAVALAGTFGNTLYTASGVRDARARQRHRALFGMEPVRRFRDLCAAAVREARMLRQPGVSAAVGTPSCEPELAHDAKVIAAELRMLMSALIDGRNKRLACARSAMS